MKKMNPVVHFELPAEDSKRMADFYTKAFGWKMDVMGPDMGNYVVVTTTEVGDNRRPKTPGAINGGFFQKSAENKNPTVVIAVDDIHESMEEVKKAGGTIVSGPDDIPGVGVYVAIQDTEGNRVAMLQPSPNM
jgi:predicted enzyme related to lactoylglutathione lyase